MRPFHLLDSGTGYMGRKELKLTQIAGICLRRVLRGYEGHNQTGQCQF